MKKPPILILIAAILFASTLPLFAQLASDPSDRMYTDLKLWEDRGILHNLPPMKPYPIQVLKQLLSEVQEKGNADDAAKARDYFSQIDGIGHIHAFTDVQMRTNIDNGYAQVMLGGWFQGSVDPLVSYSGYIAGIANNESGNSVLPEYGRSMIDYVYDGAVQPLASTNFVPRVSSATAAALGTDTLYFQAGDIRGSYGPFWGDNAILSPSTPQTGQFSLVFRHQYFTVTEIVMAISAVNSDGTGGPYPDKFLSLHSIEFYPLPWLTFSIFESIVWGNRFDLIYTLPFAAYYYAQGLNGFPDNSFIGLTGGIKFANAVRADFILYVDDASFNDLIKLHFNTLLEFTYQVGVSWTPNMPFLTRLSLNGIIVTPYTYTHTTYSPEIPDQPNYLNYTNAGQNIGPSLQPNSARIELSALLRPVPLLDLDPFARLTVHGNAGEGYPGGTGTIFDDAYGIKPHPYSTFHFLTQSNIEQTFQAGFDSKAYLDTRFGQLQFSLGYTFEYIVNPGATAAASQINNYLGIGVKYSY